MRLQALDGERVCKIEDLVNENARLQAIIARLEPFARGKGMGDRPPVVIVNSLPKTGSQTIHKSLLNSGLDLIVHHHHAISDQGIAKSLECARSLTFLKRRWGEFASVKKAANARQDIINEMARADGRRPFFVCGVREPVGMFLSYMFESGLQRSDDRSDDGGAIDLQRLVSRMEGWFASPSVTLDAYLPGPEEWLRREITDFLGIETLGSDFDPARGYKIYDGELGRLLMIRVEDLDRVFSAAMEELLGIPVPAATRRDTNVAQSKQYADDYEAVVENIAIPAALLDRIYTMDYAKTFYSSEEISRLRLKWDRGS